MKISVIGLGFVGLTTALGFSENGISTIGFDISQSKIGLIKSGKIPFYEPKLEDALSRNLGNNFSIAENINEAIDGSEIIFICVGTPKGSDGSADLSQIKSAIDAVCTIAKGTDEKIILIKSTVPPSTTDKMLEYIYTKYQYQSGNIVIGMNPEFLREGHAWDDFMKPGRIVVGINCGKGCREKIERIYSGFGNDIIFTNPRTAEFLKYLSNTLLSTLISFSNEMSLVAKKIGGIDVVKAFDILHLDQRFYGNPANIVSYIYPGCGYGGYCLPKDTEAIAKLSENLGYKPAMLESNLSTNSKIMKILLGDFINKYKDRSITVGLLGLSFKPDSDDVRETPAFLCIKTLQDEGYQNIIVYDPMAMTNFAHTYPFLHIEYAENEYDLLSKSAVIIILTAWKKFADLDFGDREVFNFRYMSLKNKELEN